MSSPLADETASSGSGDIGNELGSQSIRSYLLRDISLKSADLPMLACSFLSGLVDGVAFNAGAVFVSMQTGTGFSILHVSLAILPRYGLCV
jgi:hypothetical protein